MAASYPPLTGTSGNNHGLAFSQSLGNYDHLFSFSRSNTGNIEPTARDPQGMVHLQTNEHPRTATSESISVTSRTLAPNFVLPIHSTLDFTLIFPNQPKLQTAAESITSSSWFRNNEEEPEHDAIVQLKQEGCTIPRNFKASRFDLFLPKDVTSGWKKYTCAWYDKNGICKFKNARLDLSRCHIFNHFGYKPIGCDSCCGTQNCQARFTSKSRLNDHQSRCIIPKRLCYSCMRMITAQNIVRHRKTCSRVKYNQMSLEEQAQFESANDEAWEKWFERGKSHK